MALLVIAHPSVVDTFSGPGGCSMGQWVNYANDPMLALTT